MTRKVFDPLPLKPAPDKHSAGTDSAASWVQTRRYWVSQLPLNGPRGEPAKAFPASRANKRRIKRYNSQMGVSRCRVSFTDSEGIPHAVEVQADSLYEAVALAVAEFRADELTATPGPMTDFTVSIERPAIEHRIRLSQVSRWAEGNTREGPAGLIKRQRIRALLENRMPEPRK